MWEAWTRQYLAFLVSECNTVWMDVLLTCCFDWLNAIKICCKMPDKRPLFTAGHFVWVLMHYQKMTAISCCIALVRCKPHLSCQDTDLQNFPIEKLFVETSLLTTLESNKLAQLKCWKMKHSCFWLKADSDSDNQGLINLSRNGILRVLRLGFVWPLLSSSISYLFN